MLSKKTCTSYIYTNIIYHIISYTHIHIVVVLVKKAKEKKLYQKKKAKENDGSWRESQFINLINDYLGVSNQSKVVKSKSPKRGPREEAGEG